ncbi:MAG: fibronectin type III domain-containing protein [Eubacterium sp.]
MKKILSIVIVVLLLVISLAFTTTVFATNIPSTTITSVKTKSEAFTIKWKKKTNIAGYQIQYSANSKFKRGNKTIKIKKVKTLSKKITGLKPSKKYYVRIRTYKIVNKKTYYSSWSKKKNVTTKNCEHCTNNNNHSTSCGNIGKWFNTKDEIEEYRNNISNKYCQQYENGEITWEEYMKKSPYGYECWSCGYCGKWTGSFKYR